MNERITIGVCCQNFTQATNGFKKWVAYLGETEPEYLEEFDRYTLSVKFGGMFCYIFFDEKLLPLFDCVDAILYLDEFFQLEGVTDPWKGVMF